EGDPCAFGDRTHLHGVDTATHGQCGRSLHDTFTALGLASWHRWSGRRLHGHRISPIRRRSARARPPRPLSPFVRVVPVPWSSRNRGPPVTRTRYPSISPGRSFSAP